LETFSFAIKSAMWSIERRMEHPILTRKEQDSSREAAKVF
jgi:hypothetical protein